MKPHSRIPIGLVALTLASIALALLVFWSFRGAGLSAPSNIQMSDDGKNRPFETAEKADLALSPAIFAVFVLSLLTTYWVGRQSGPLRSARSRGERGQLVDPSFLRARASLLAAMGSPDEARSDLAEEGGSPGREQQPAAEAEFLPKQQMEQAELIHPLELLSQNPENKPEAEDQGRRRLSTTGPLLGLSLESRIVYFGQTGIRVSTDCPVRTSMCYIIRAMKQVSHSSRQLDQLVKIMDDFVFQANLLALEAAVEAGRTGQGGRGLISVASRSRQLAVCSAETARNTADLVASPQAQIMSGSEMVQSVAENFITPGPGNDAAETAFSPALESSIHK